MRMFAELYAREKLSDLDRRARQPRIERVDVRAPLAGADVPRTGVGLRHEVFRRIAGDARPARPSFWRRLTA
jgi:hypothetical protein